MTQRKKILYGVAGEGMGHALRSKVILDHLTQKHDVTIVTSNRAFNYLNQYFDNVIDVHGLVISYKDNKVQNIGTLFENLWNMPLGTMKNALVAAKLYKLFPDLVISDYESFSYYYGRSKLAPVVALDNIQAINRCELKVPKGFQLAYQIARGVNKMRTPFCSRYFITSFAYPKVLPEHQKNTELVPPILRPAILEAKTEKQNHIIVYQTSDSYTDLVPALNTLNDQRFIVYGLRRNLKENKPDEIIGNCHIKNNDEYTFLEDLRTAKAVITNGGFTLISEALHLGKPILSVPVQEHFEQAYNGLALDQMGYGKFAPEITKEVVEEFLNNLGNYEKNLAKYPRQDNSKLLTRLDEYIASLK